MALSGKVTKRLSGLGVGLGAVFMAAGQAAVSSPQTGQPKPLVPPPGGQVLSAPSSSATSSAGAETKTKKAATDKPAKTPTQAKPKPKPKLRDVR